MFRFRKYSLRVNLGNGALTERRLLYLMGIAAVQVFFLLTVSSVSYAALSGNKRIQDTTSTLFINDSKPITPIQVIIGDTARAVQSTKKDPALPGEYRFDYSAEQDSAYLEAMKLRLPPQTRIKEVLHATESNWQLQSRLREGEPWQIALKNVQSIPPNLFIPSEMEVVHHRINIISSQYVPYLNTMPSSGAKIPLDAIGAFLGISEDVSPTIKYKLEYISNVEIVVYSLQAVVVATVFRGTQPGGSYSVTWSGRDDFGKKMPSGDYIGEVRIGNEKYIRKRILIY